MKRVILIAATAIAAVTWVAPAKAEISDLESEICLETRDRAVYAMVGRQMGLSKEEVLVIMDDKTYEKVQIEALTAVDLRLNRSMVNLAFIRPIVDGEESKATQAKEFARGQELRCLVNFNKD